MDQQSSMIFFRTIQEETLLIEFRELAKLDVIEIFMRPRLKTIIYFSHISLVNFYFHQFYPAYPWFVLLAEREAES